LSRARGWATTRSPMNNQTIGPEIAQIARSVAACVDRGVGTGTSVDSACIAGLLASEVEEGLPTDFASFVETLAAAGSPVECLATQTLLAAAYIDGASADLTVAEEYQVGNAEGGVILRGLRKVTLIRDGNRWRISRWKYGLLDAIRLPEDASPSLYCGEIERA
jgi:hypothetical protein